MAQSVMIDVREQSEYDAEHVEGSILIPLSQFAAKAPQALAGMKGADLVIMCRSGMRAGSAMMQLGQMGLARNFKSVTVYPGGILAWRGQGKATVKGQSSGLMSRLFGMLSG